jgi:hypothetical protein
MRSKEAKHAEVERTVYAWWRRVATHERLIRVDMDPIAKPPGITHSGFECELGRARPCMAMIQAPFLWSPRTP